ncbi:MAG: hypothetical protein CVV41_10220 [Candidatus Riflebacteria bacterium HGW-Riflebacteria-1]|jgi:hypothetical protein|nr:MAG: hypothetical protein CVV41_10220 [Candidatus Riflebacteria bacterium HGW-Riflebacteria-1]
MFLRRKNPGGSRHEAEDSMAGALGANFSVIIDTIKVIFKLSPDDGQTYSEFLLEKLGALSLLLVSFIVLALLLGALYLMH